jgi:hypothetical protein
LDEDDDYNYGNDDLEPKSIPMTTDMPEIIMTTLRTRINNEDTTVKIFTQKSPTQQQTAAIVNPDRSPVKLVQTQNGKTFTYPLSKKETKAEMKLKSTDETAVENDIPSGFKEIQNTNPHEDITISKTTQKIKYKTRYLPSKPSDSGTDKNQLKPDSFVSVTKSLSGSVDENNQENGKVASTYFTKSSTCGQFAFSCNIVYGNEGRSRICRPKQNNPKC